MSATQEDKRIFAMIGIMGVVVITVLILTTVFLYRASIEEEKTRLVEIVRSQARLLEVLVEKNENENNIGSATSISEVVRVLSEAHQQYERMGNTSEFSLARREGNLIIYLLRHRHQEVDYPVPVPFDSGIDEPMRQALLGNSGTMVALDYRGERVLAAYEPVLDGRMGIVAKIDLAELSTPYLRAVGIALLVAFLMSAAGVFGFLRLSNPILQQLEANRQRWQFAIAGSGAGVWDWDIPAGKITYSTRYQQILNLPPEKSEDSVAEWENRIFPEDKAQVLNLLQQYLRGEITEMVGEYRLQNAKGGYCWVINRGKVMSYDRNQRPLRMIGVIFDISKRKQMEEALRDSESRYRQLFEMESDALFLIENETGRIIETNQAGCNLYGFTREEILQKKNTDLSAEPEKTRKVTLAEVPFVPVRYHRKQDGTIFPVEITGSHFNWQGKSIHIAAIRDITQRMKSEETLRQSEERYRSIVEGMPLLVFRFLPDGKLSFVNGQCNQFFKLDYDAMEGRNFSEFVHFGDRNTVIDTYQKLSMAEPVLELEHRMANHAGEERMMRSVFQALFDQHGELLEYQAVCIDITERHYIEMSMIEADKMATLGTLAAGIAHEINSPLQVITGLSDRHKRMLANQKTDVDLLKRDIDAINRNAWRVANIVRSLLTYSRASVEHVVHSDLSEIVQDSLLLIEHQLSSWSNITVKTDLATDLPPLYCEQNNISQVIINLLTNARDAMPDGGVITISTAYDAATQRFLLKVSDTGNGISESIRARIFDPFFTTKEVGKGTGLGLSIVSSIVQAHGGEIDVESSPETGTTFIVRLVQKPPIMSSEADSLHGRFPS